MIRRREILVALLGELALAAPLLADMMPVLPPNSPRPQQSRAGPIGDPQVEGLSDVLSHHAAGTLSLRLADSPDWQDVAAPAGEDLRLQILADRQSSLALCLYGLLGFGAVRSLACVKKLSFSPMPLWHDCGAPAPIGSRYALGPDCLCCALPCFTPLDSTGDERPPPYGLRTLVPLWRKSQFTFSVLAARGPPRCSARDSDCLREDANERQTRQK
jgi:hypothetical protein